MLILVGSKMLAVMITLIVIWAWQSYKHEYKHNPLITNNVIKNQDDHRNISRPWDALDSYRNLSSARKTVRRRKEAQ